MAATVLTQCETACAFSGNTCCPSATLSKNRVIRVVVATDDVDELGLHPCFKKCSKRHDNRTGPSLVVPANFSTSLLPTWFAGPPPFSQQAATSRPRRERMTAAREYTGKADRATRAEKPLLPRSSVQIPRCYLTAARCLDAPKNVAWAENPVVPGCEDRWFRWTGSRFHQYANRDG
jgi:hypothetical protein